MSRLEVIRKMVDSQPNDPFPRYGLAMELKNAGQLADAHAQFEELERRFPEYIPQFLMHGNVLSALQRRDDARAVLSRGIAVAQKARNAHALGEMQSALDQLNSGEDD